MIDTLTNMVRSGGVVSTAYPECEDVAGLMDAGEDASDTNGGPHLHVAADIAQEKHKHTITTEIQ